MAETAPKDITAHPADGRPPKVFPEEAEFLLLQGPYIARRKAAERILDTVMAHIDDEVIGGYFQPEYVQRLRDDVAARKLELQTFTRTESVPLSVFLRQKEKEEAESARRIDEIVSVSEFKPSATPVAPRNSRDIEGRDNVSLYLEEIARTPLLNAEQEVELSKTIEAGLLAEKLLAEGRYGRKNGGAPKSASKDELQWLMEEGQRAQQTFLESNLRLVVSIARKYGRSQMPMLDLIQEGNTGLIRAVEKFDYTKGYKFSTYATWWVKQAITRGIAQQSRMVRLPVHVVEEVSQLNKLESEMTRLLGREPEAEELAHELGIDVSRVMDLMDWRREHTSLDAPIDDDGETSLGDLLGHDAAPSPEDAVVNASVMEQLEIYLSYLDSRSEGIVRMRNGLLDGRQHKLADIGARYGISAERVRQVEREAIERLKGIARAIDSGQNFERPSELAIRRAGEQPGDTQVQKQDTLTKPLGVRAKRREEERKVFEAIGLDLETKHKITFEAYLATQSLREAGKRLDIQEGSFGTRLKMARAALAELTEEPA